MEVLLFRATMGNKSHNPAIEVYSHGRAARKKGQLSRAKGWACASVGLGEVCAGLAGDLDLLETLQVSRRWIQERTIIRRCDRCERFFFLVIGIMIIGVAGLFD